MRLSPALIAAALSLTGCTVVVQPSSTGSAPAREPVRAPEPLTPLEVTLAPPVNGRLYIQTNRPAYVAIFEIVPGQGVTLLQPANTRQRTVTYSGMNWVEGQWSTPVRGTSASRGRRGPVLQASSSSTQRSRYIYALASDRPLSLPDQAFQPNGMHHVIGDNVYGAAGPAMTMRTIARAVVPPVQEEMWAEDAILLAAEYDERAESTVRVYCGRGTVYVVPVDVADRAWCPSGGSTARPALPDSVVHDNGRRVQRRPAEPPGRRTIDRVGTLPVDDNPGNGVGRPEDRGVGRPDDRGNNGRKLGHTDSTKAGGGRADPGRPEQTGGLRPMAVPTRTEPPKGERPENSAKQDDKGEPDDKGKPEDKGTPDDKGKPDDTGKPDDKGKPDNTGKPDDAGKPEAKPDTAKSEKPTRPPRRRP